MIICLCEGISAFEIERAAQNGASSIEEVADGCHAGKGCGACHEQILEIIHMQKLVDHEKPYDISATGELKNVGIIKKGYT